MDEKRSFEGTLVGGRRKVVLTNGENYYETKKKKRIEKFLIKWVLLIVFVNPNRFDRIRFTKLILVKN